MKYSHKCFGSRLDIVISSPWDYSKLVEKCFNMADSFEQKYSRFIDGNFLSYLNSQKEAHVDKEFMSLIKLSLQVSKITQGHFDITLLPLLENKWYGIHDGAMWEDIWYENIVLTETNIELKDNISIDIWAVWKGYMVDKIYNTLSPQIEEFVVNFGWDIRVKWKQLIELEDPNDEHRTLGNIEIINKSIASSAGNKRKFQGWHHLIDPKTKTSQQDKIALYVTHNLASFADIFSTALFVTPLEKSLEILEKTKWLEALIIWADGKMYKSKWFNCKLSTRLEKK